MKKLLLLILLAWLVLSACVDEGNGIDDFGETQQTEETPTYTIFHIEGMPCVWVQETVTSHRGWAGLSCDWSKYQPGG